MKEQTKNRLTKAGWLLFYLYIVMLSYFLFFSEHYGRDFIIKGYRYNLVLFKEIRRFIKYRQLLGFESFAVNILGNVIAFMPFGFLLPILNRKFRRFFYVAFLSLTFSLLIECLQLFFKVGIFDVDDIFMNTVGGIFGYLLFAVMYFSYRRLCKRGVKRGGI